MVQRKVPFGTSPLFPELEVKDKPKTKRVKKVVEPIDKDLCEPEEVQSEVVSSMMVLLFPESYPDEYALLQQEMVYGSWDCITGDNILEIQWHMMNEFEETWSKDDSAKEHYIDYAMWVLLDDEEDEANPFSYKNTVRSTYEICPDTFAAVVALRIVKGRLKNTKAGDVFRRIHNKYEEKLSFLIIRAGFEL